MNETDLVHAIVKTINATGAARVWRSNTGRRGRVSFGKRGSADVTGYLRDGRRVELEVKLDTMLSTDQTLFLRDCRMWNVACGVVMSLEGALEFMRAAAAGESLATWQTLF